MVPRVISKYSHSVCQKQNRTEEIGIILKVSKNAMTNPI